MVKRITLLCAGLTMVAAGCDLFQTREPEPPSQGTSCNATPDVYDVVLKNLTCAIAEQNADNYVRCFADPNLQQFVFEPSPDEQSKFTLWTLDFPRTGQDWAPALQLGGFLRQQPRQFGVHRDGQNGLSALGRPHYVCLQLGMRSR